MTLQEGVSVSDSSLQTEERAGHKESEDQSDDEDKENEPEEEEEEDDGGGWITPSNIKQVKMDTADWTAPADVRVGCLTTDFAMQVTDAATPSVFHSEGFCKLFTTVITVCNRVNCLVIFYLRLVSVCFLHLFFIAMLLLQTISDLNLFNPLIIF